MKKLFLCLLFALPIACSAESTSCKYNASFIKETAPTGSNIQSFEWQKQRDPDSDEHVAKLKIIYKDHNTAVIEHKYCDMYNFEYTYSVNKNPNSLSKADIVKHLTEGFKQSKIKLKLKTKLDKIISQALNQYEYDVKTPFSIGLPVDQVTYNDNVEYGIEYMPNKNGTSASTLTLYISIGGA